ncbi:MAG: histidine phosphatase family protein [Anaerolineaceae bacterium]|jgi:broad specificity phosphatase PhoE
MMNNNNQKTEFWLVRHGQTDWNVEGRYQGQTDMPLNPAGIQQARDLAAKIRMVHFDMIYASDLGRARETAQILAGDRQVIFDPRLREIKQGEWEGALFSEIRQRFAGFFENRQEDPLNSRPPGGESLKEVADRVLACVDAIAAENKGARILLVSHGLSLATILARAEHIPLENAFELILPNTEPKIVYWPPEESGE